MQEQSKEFNFNGENIYIGMDIHLKSWSVTILTEYAHYKTFSQPAEPALLIRYLHEHFPGGNYYSAYEAGFSGFWIHYQLESLGVKNIVVNPADIPTTSKELWHKSDVIDSKKIARSLRGKELNGIYIPEQPTLQIRSLIRLRASLVRDSTRIKYRIKALLHFYGIKIPAVFTNSSYASGKFVSWLREDAANVVGMGKDSLLFLVECLEAQKQQLLRITGKIRAYSRSDKYSHHMDLIKSVPGIGLITGITFLTEIESITRFANSDKFAGFIGIIPSFHSSGDKEHKGEMTPRGTVVIIYYWCRFKNRTITVRFSPYFSTKYLFFYRML